MINHRMGTLPPEIEDVVRQVLEAADLHVVDGRTEVARELRAHFEDGLAAGASPQELIRRFGDPAEAGKRIARTRPRAAARNRGEQGRWWMSMGEWMEELRRATRRLGRAPGFAAVVVLTLALGVGANTAIFTVLNAVLLEDLPYPEPDRLVRIYEAFPESGPSDYLRVPVTVEYRGWDEVFEEVAAMYTYREVGADLTDGDRPERVTLLRVSAGYFETLGIAPARGRTFSEEESYGPGENVTSTEPITRVAVVSDRLWRSRLGGRDDVLGTTVQLNGFAYEVVGIMPARFKNPIGTDPDIWVPLDMRSGGSNSFGNFYLTVVGRLKPGVSLEAAQARVSTLGDAYVASNPETYGSKPFLAPLHADVVGETRQSMLWLLAMAAGLVLLTACVNVANLLFARGLSRDRDLALRSALGSGRGRLIAGILTENGLLALSGGVLGLGLGWLGLKGMLRLAPDALPLAAEVQIGGSVFAFAFAVTTAALLAFGLAPALRMSRTAPAEVLRAGDRSSTVGRAVKRLRDGMVVVQVAAALVLVTGSLLLTQSFNNLMDVPLGVDAQGVLTYEVHLPGARYTDGATRNQFHEELQARVAALPEVEAVGATSWLPANGPYHTWGFQWVREGASEEENRDFKSTDVRIIAGDYFGAMGIEMLQGPSPAEVDLESEPMVWLNRQAIDQYFGGVDPVGEVIVMAGNDRRIMGVVEDIAENVRGGHAPKAYIPHVQYADNRNWALIQTVKARGDLADVRERIRGELASVDPQLVLYRPQSFEGVLDRVRAQDRFATVLMGAFALLALVLSLVGTYGVLSGSVAGRTREIGIRMALGADSDQLRRMVLRYAAGLTLPGIVLGLAGAWAASRWIEALLFEVESVDLVAYVASAAVFLVVGLFSGWLPARRATKVDTVQVLTAE